MYFHIWLSTGHKSGFSLTFNSVGYNCAFRHVVVAKGIQKFSNERLEMESKYFGFESNGATELSKRIFIKKEVGIA
jgi:hypothetical protein